MSHQQIFESVRDSWRDMGHDNPWHSVMTGFSKTKDINDSDKDAFYASGQFDVKYVMEVVKLSENATGVAMDFGCGLGRLTFALAKIFRTVYGCDQSEPHLSIASQQAAVRAPGKDVRFKINTMDLKDVVDQQVDFVLSLITLQHMPPVLMEHYIRQFCMVLKSRGVCYFQVPVHIPGYHEDKSSDDEKASRGGLQMHCIELSRIMTILQENECTIVSIHQDDRIGIEYGLSLGVHFIKK